LVSEKFRMSRTVKWMCVGIGGLLLLAVLAVVLLPPLVNLERYRTLLAQRVGRALGREVTLGALRVSLWGGIGAEAESIHVGQASGFGTEPFLSAEALRVRVELLPLLRGQVRVASAVLERPRVRLVHGSDGRWNVEDLFRGRTSQGAARPPAETTRPGRAPLFGGLLLSEVSVRNGETASVGRPTAGAHLAASM
jgi:AsmA protein